MLFRGFLVEEQAFRPAKLACFSNRGFRVCVRTCAAAYGAQITFPLYPALRLRLRAGLLLFRPCGAGFLALHSTAANKTQFSHRLFSVRVEGTGFFFATWSSLPLLPSPLVYLICFHQLTGQ